MATFKMRDGSGSVELNWILEDKDRHGNVRLYVRRHGRTMIRLRQRPGTDAFLAEYRAAIAILEAPPGAAEEAKLRRRRKPATPKSLSWLIEQYYRSAEFRQLDPRTCYVCAGVLEKIRPAQGDKPYRMLEARHVAKWRDARADRPGSANNLLKVLRRLFSWAMLPHVALADRNPAKDVPYLKAKSADGWHSWTPEEVEAFEARWPIGSKPRLALALLLYTGVRRGDVVLLGQQMIRNGWLTFTVSKGKERRPVHLSLPVLPELQAIIAATPRPRPKDGVEPLTFLMTDYAKPFTSNGFGNAMRKWCDAAGLPHCSAHGLRKAGAALAAERGASERQLMAIFGWSTMKQAEHYTRAARQKVLAGEAMRHLAPRGPETAPQGAPAPAVRAVPGGKPG